MQFDKQHFSTAVEKMRADIGQPDKKFIDITGKALLVGYWHNWMNAPDSGFQQGEFANLALTDIPLDYNVVTVAFMYGAGIPSFIPATLSDQEFRRQVGVLNARGQAVLISLGGADALIELYSGDVYPLALEIIRLTETYGFDGLDIDLEQQAINFAENATVIPAALKIVKEHYRLKQQNFIISMAPEFPYLRDSGLYLPYLNALEGEYDYITPQFYNQGGDGIWVEEASNGQGAWLAQNNDSVKTDFIYYLCESLAKGTRGFTQIAFDKLVPGLPANRDAAASGYVVDPQNMLEAFRRLRAANIFIRGLMVWSVNWDAGHDRNGNAYNWGFVQQYASLSPPNAPGIPLPPTSLVASDITDTGLMLSWHPSVSPGVTRYLVFCNGTKVSEVGSNSWKASGLKAATVYKFYAVALNAGEQQSVPSQVLKVKTTATGPVLPPAGDADWSGDGHLYALGDRVTYRSRRYQCLQKHTSIQSWAPSVSVSLWILI